MSSFPSTLLSSLLIIVDPPSGRFSPAAARTPVQELRLTFLYYLFAIAHCTHTSTYLFCPVDSTLVILGRIFSNHETLGALILLTVLIIFLISIGSLLISSLMVGAAIVAIHGTFRMPEDLFLDDQEPPTLSSPSPPFSMLPSFAIATCLDAIARSRSSIVQRPMTREEEKNTRIPPLFPPSLTCLAFL